MAIANDDFKFLQEWLVGASGLVLEDHQRYLAEARLVPLLKDLGCQNIQQLIDRLKNRVEHSVGVRIAAAMSTRETQFFRDPHVFRAFQKIFLPDILERNHREKTLRLWSCCCSSGQEPYSISMAMLESAKQLNWEDWRISILASDMNPAMGKRVVEGCYSHAEVTRGLPASHLVKYFDRVGADWRVQKRLQAPLRFECINVIEELPFLSSMDVIFLRNALIYFSPKTRKEILRVIHKVLRPGGFLILGASEAIIDRDNLFRQEIHGKTIVYRPE